VLTSKRLLKARGYLKVQCGTLSLPRLTVRNSLILAPNCATGDPTTNTIGSVDGLTPRLFTKKSPQLALGKGQPESSCISSKTDLNPSSSSLYHRQPHTAVN
jgi:hypothetical protein